jgi:hypothetical protein
VRPLLARTAAATALLISLALPSWAQADDLSFAIGSGSPFALDSLPRDNVVADFDADGHGDVAIGDFVGQDPIRIFWGAAGGGVAQTTELPAPQGSAHIAVGRLDPDADLDFAICDKQVVPYYKNDGARGFTAGAGVPIDTGGEAYDLCYGLAIADFDQDLDRDIAFAVRDVASSSPTPGQMRTLVNNGAATPTFTIGAEGPVDEYAGEVVTGRFNNDNDPDLAYRVVTPSTNAAGVQVMTGAAGAGFVEGERVSTGPVGLFSDLVAGDLDGDGFDDLVVDSDATVRWADGAGTGTFPTSLDVSDGFYNEVQLGNMTAGSALDIVAIGEPTRIFVNRGSRQFSLGYELAFPEQAYAMQGNVGDLDADPRDDLALTVDIDDDFDDDFFKLLTRDEGLANPFGVEPPDDGGDGDSGGGDTTPPPTTPPTSAPPDTLPPPPAPQPVPPTPTVPVTARQIATLPAAAKRPCGSRRNFRIRLRRPPEGVSVVEARVLVNGKRVKVVRGARLTAPVDLRGFPKGRAVVTIRITLADGRVLRGRRVYRPCATKKRKGRFGRRRG